MLHGRNFHDLRPETLMDVRCSRCATEYEFDDALISERGTTVKCTNCGFQFKIFPPKAAAVAPERWVVRTAEGRELVYTSLRELQRGISDRQVGPNDLLSRGTTAARPLGSIPELEPFFAATSSRPMHRAPRTLHGVAPPAGMLAGGSGERVPDTARSPDETPTGGMFSGVPRVVAPPAPSAALPVAPPVRRIEPGPLSATVPAAGVPFTPKVPDASLLSPARAPVTAPATAPVLAPAPAPLRTSDSDLRGRGPQPEAGPLSQTVPAAVSPSTLPPRPPQSGPISARRESFASYGDDLSTDDSGRRAKSRWIAAIVILGVLGLFAATVGKQYLERFIARPAAGGPPAPDSRVAGFLKEGTRLLDEGDFEGAKEQLVKAQTLSDKNAAVLSALARLETMRADVFWLKLRLLDPASTELVQSTHRELGRRVGKAREAVDAAFGVSPEEPAVVRARVDSMRLSGESDKAREWLGPIAAKPADAENAYVLAALDMGETNPAWPSIAERLRPAAASKKESVRARAALIYALAQAGSMGEAESEFEKLESEAHAHPLLDELKSFVQRMKALPRDAGTDAAAAPAATVDVSKLPALDTTQGPESSSAGRAEAPGDFRQRLVQAHAAVNSGNLARAEQLFQSVLNEQPNSTEALSGLADVAKRRGDRATAARLYQRVLDQNPTYLPALMSSADAKWDAGDRKGAVVLYKRVLEQAGPGTEYGQRAQARIAEAGKEGAAAAPTVTAAAPTAAPTPTSAPAPKPDQPNIDTSDLPGFNK